MYASADPVLRDAMALAYYTGQRVSDVLKIRRTDLRDGTLWIRQGKTSANLRIAVEGELRRTIERITGRGIVGLYLLTGERGEHLTYDALQGRFRKARTAADVEFQFRDLRAKAATDLENLELAVKRAFSSTRCFMSGSGSQGDHCGPSFVMRPRSFSTSSGLRSDSGGRTGPALCPTTVAPAFTMLTA